jgi:conjugal transfer pilus assembly protein TraD
VNLLPAFENPFRPIYEYSAIAAWIAGGVLCLVSAAVSPYPTAPFVGFSIFAFLMAAWRGRTAWRLARRQRRLEGVPLTFMTRAQLREICAQRPDEVFLGFGFEWTQAEVQLAHTMVRSNPQALLPRSEKRMGQPWIHGLGAYEEPIFIPFDHTAGHTLLVGTTRAGKSRMADTLLAQAIARGLATLIIDPKGDNALAHAARQAVIERDGNADNFVYFHPAHPEKSARIDPLRNFNRATELASRIAALIPSETGADPFTAFGQMALTNIIQGLLIVDEKPTLASLRRYLEGGMANLVIRAVQAYCLRRAQDLNWKEALKRFTEHAKPGDHDQAHAHVKFYFEYLAPRLPSSDLEGLLSIFTRNAEHTGKMLASLFPVLVMLTSGHIGKLLSPDPTDVHDTRPITDFSRIIRNKQVCYVGLDALSDKFVASAIGSMFLADLASVSGDRYNYEANPDPVTVFVDEAAEITADPFIAMLNKAGGSGVRITMATQTTSDLSARTGSQDKGRMVLGNLNNVISLRVLDGHTQAYVTEACMKTYVRHVEYSQSTKGETDEPFVFSGTTSESLKEVEVPMVSEPMLGCLPNLEFFARVSGGRLVKARIPILVDELPDLA